MKSLVVVALVVGSGSVAFARDHLELVCSAVVDAKDGGERVPLFVHLFEHRSADGVSRDETLSNIYQGKLFQATRINKSGDFSANAPIVLTSGKAIRFRGKYTLAPADDTYMLMLDGVLAEDPFARKPMFREVTATLTCVDLSI